MKWKKFQKDISMLDMLVTNMLNTGEICHDTGAILLNLNMHLL